MLVCFLSRVVYQLTNLTNFMSCYAAITNLVLTGFSCRIEKGKVIKEEYRMNVERNVSVTVSQRVLITHPNT